MEGPMEGEVVAFCLGYKRFESFSVWPHAG